MCETTQLIDEICIALQKMRHNDDVDNQFSIPVKQFLLLLEETLKKTPPERALPVYIALLGVDSVACPEHAELAAIVSDAADAVVKINREQTVPKLQSEIEVGIKEFGDCGWNHGDSIPWRSWNSAFLLARMSANDGILRANPAAIDLLCFILTYSPEGPHLNNYEFPYASVAMSALSNLPDDEVVAALRRALDDRLSYRREYVAERIAEYAARGKESAISILLQMCRTESADGACPGDLALSTVLSSRPWKGQPELFRRFLCAVADDNVNFERMISLCSDERGVLGALEISLQVLTPEVQKERIPEAVQPDSELVARLFMHSDAAVRAAFVRVVKDNVEDEQRNSWASETIDTLRHHKEDHVRNAAISEFGDGEDDTQ
jgi:PBS lyase HEAT-like repeat